jgi:hypothetical protein
VRAGRADRGRGRITVTLVTASVASVQGMSGFDIWCTLNRGGSSSVTLLTCGMDRVLSAVPFAGRRQRRVDKVSQN